jgi:hypothetical protein
MYSAHVRTPAARVALPLGAGGHSPDVLPGLSRVLDGVSLPTVHNLYTVVRLSLEIARTDFN